MAPNIDALVGRRVETYLDMRHDALTKAGIYLNDTQTELMLRQVGAIVELRDPDFDFASIALRHSKIDAVLIQSRGSKPQDENGLNVECERCSKGRGPFKFCIRVKGHTGGGGAYGNCRWHHQSSGCDFYYEDDGYTRIASLSPERPHATKSGREVKKPERSGMIADSGVPEVTSCTRRQKNNRAMATRSRESRRGRGLGLARRGGNLRLSGTSQRAPVTDPETDPVDSTESEQIVAIKEESE